MITEQQMGAAMPQAAAAGRVKEWHSHLVSAMDTYAITSNQRICYFMANVAEETGQLKAREENLRYSGDRLLQVFPGLFGSNPNKAYEIAAAGPEAIANYIYADAHRSPSYRLGNDQPGDGWKYRGRGPMQLTGKGNYVRFFRAIGLPADTDPDKLLAPELGSLSAAEFWSRAGCNVTADAGDFTATVRKVNGGLINMHMRLEYLHAFVLAMAA